MFIEGGNGHARSHPPSAPSRDDRPRHSNSGTRHRRRSRALRYHRPARDPRAAPRTSAHLEPASAAMKYRPAYFKRLLKFLRRKGRSHEDAEDLIQEAMLRLHLYGREVPVHNEEAFLRHAVTNLSIDQHRRNRPDLRKEVPIEELNAHSPLV